jgi:prophage regulatory protein
MTEQPQPFLRLKQVKALTGLSRSWIYEAISRGDFPRPISIGARAVAWPSQFILDWQKGQIARGQPLDRGRP